MKTHVALILDQSGSMTHLKQDVLRTYRELIQTLQSHQKIAKKGDFTHVSITLFSNTIYPLCIDQPLDKLPNFPYSPGGGTALFDAVGLTCEQLQQDPRAQDSDTAFLVLVLTDGEENQSFKYRSFNLRELIQKLQDTGRWTFVFQLPKGNKRTFCSRFQIPKDNVREWEATSEGIQETWVVTCSGLDGYYQARNQGKSQVKNFFTTDLSKITPTDLQSLDDVSSRFRSYIVDAENRIDIFVAYKTKKNYVIGSSYYLLTKDEKVQANKEILIQEKGKKTNPIYGGPKVRDLLGLPKDQDVKVKPGNHSNYNIYIQSRAPNRKLVRGTQILVDVTKKKEDQPTWQEVKSP